MRWFRFYDEALDDPKVQRLSPDVFRTWINLLCVASRNGGKLPKLSHLAFSLRWADEKNLQQHIDTLVEVGLLDVEPSLRPHNWEHRQYASDDHAARMREHRKRTRDVTRDVTCDHPEQSRTDTEIDKNPPLVPPKGGRQTRGSRLPSDWMPTTADCDFAFSLGLPTDPTANKFRDYWTAKPGAAGCKLDWSATWRNWCRREAENNRPRAGPTPAEAPQMTGPERAEWARKVLATPGRNPGLERTAKQFLDAQEMLS